jgi:hypothetical protein
MNFIYITTNLVNGKQYVGSHLGEKNDSYLGSGKPAFSNAIKKYGKENFKREIIEECDPSMNLILETKYIKEYNTLVPNGYNISPTGGNKGGGKLNEITKKRISESLKGKNKGKKHSKESREKMSKAKRGIKLSEEHKKKISESEKGRVFSNETKKRISKSLKGKPSNNKGVPMSIEQKEKISKANKGRKYSEETKEKLKGRKLSPEHCKNLSLSMKGRKRGPYKKHKL